MLYNLPRHASSKLVTIVFLSFFCSVCAASAAGREQGRGFSAGMASSVRGVGLCGEFSGEPGWFNSFFLTLDLMDILNGRASTPGLKLNYFYNKVLATFGEGKFSLYAGPGVTGGYVRNTDGHPNFMGGLSVDAGFSMKCLNSINLSIDFQADLAFSLKDGNSNGLSIYKAGFLHSYYPFVKIAYRF